MKKSETFYNNTVVTIKSDNMEEENFTTLFDEIDKLFLKIFPQQIKNTNKNFNKWIGNRIRAKRSEIGLSMERLSEMAGLGLTRSCMSNIENGKQNLSAYQYMKIKAILGKDLDI